MVSWEEGELIDITTKGQSSVFQEQAFEGTESKCYCCTGPVNSLSKHETELLVSQRLL